MFTCIPALMSCNYALALMVSFNKDKVSHTLVFGLIQVAVICVQWRQEIQNGGEPCGSFFLPCSLSYAMYIVCK